MRQQGFTVIELVIVIVFLALVGVVFYSQYSSLESSHRDQTRRTAINAMYYNLEDVFYAKNNYYPKTINETNLTAMDKSLFTDPNGKKIGAAGSTYSYEPTDGNNDQCKGYTLRTTRENEADFIKTSKH